MNIEKMKEWLKNKDFRAWKRLLLLLCETGKPMTSKHIGTALGIYRSNAHRTLRKLQIDGQVRSETIGKNRIIWSITSKGKKLVRDMQKKELLPKRD